MVKVFLVNDHEVVRRGLIELLGADPELDFVGEAGSVAEAMERIPAAGPPSGSGYVVKDIKGMELACAIKDVGAGRSLLDNGSSGLNDRERTLLDLLSEGLTNKQIADRMLVTEEAVQSYVSRLLVKLGVARQTRRIG